MTPSFLWSLIFSTGWLFLLSASPARSATEVARIDKIEWRADVTGNSAKVSKHVRKTVHSAAGKKYGIVVEGESDFYKLQRIEIRLLDADGKVIRKHGKKDMTKQCGFGQSFQVYAEHCTYYMEFAVPTYPYTIEYDCLVEYRSLFMLSAPGLDYSIPVTEAIITVASDSTAPIAWKLYGLEATPEVSNNGHTTSLTWRFSNIPADEDLNYLPPEEVDVPRLALAAERFKLAGHDFNGRSWKNFGLFYKELSAGRYLPGTDTAAVGRGTKEDLHAIYMDVLKRTRYVSVDLDLSGWQTEPALTVQSKGYGDCKGLSCLLVSKLRLAGVEAYPALVLTADQGATDEEFPLDRFNHVITFAVVGGDTVWMDPTCSECPLGVIPSQDQGCLALVVTDTGGVLRQVPFSEPEDNTLTRMTSVDMSEAGTVSIQTTETITGLSALYFRSAFKRLENANKNAWIKEWFLGSDTRYALASYDLTGLEDITTPVVLSAFFTSTKPLDQIKNVLYFVPFIFAAPDAYDNISLKERTVAVCRNLPFVTVDSVIIAGPLLAMIDSVALQPGDNVEGAGRAIVSSWSRTPEGAVAVLRQQSVAPCIEPSEFPELMTFISARRKLLNQPLKLYLDSSQPVQ